MISQHYGKPYQVFDRERINLFPETEISSTLAEDGAAGALANSFLVEAAVDNADNLHPQVYYAKLNSGRKESFRIGTKICGTGKPTQVFKFSLNTTADKHIQQILKNENILSRNRNVLQGKQDKSEIIYDYFHFLTLEDILREAASREDKDQIVDIFEKIKTLAMIQPSVAQNSGDDFVCWFGETKAISKVLHCSNPANIDLVPDNIFIDSENLILTDCEWVTDFPVPVNFTVWRSIENAWSRIPALEEIIHKDELFRKLEIDSSDIPAFRAWSWHFENHYVSNGGNARFAKQVRQTEYTPIQAERMADEIKKQAGHIDQLMESERDLKGMVDSQATHIDELIVSERNLKSTVVSQKAHIDELMESERKLKGTVNSQATHIDELMKSERELKGTVNNQAAHIDQLLESERRLNGTVENQKTHIAQLTETEHQLNAELQEVYSSMSWRMTKVFRIIHKKLSRI